MLNDNTLDAVKAVATRTRLPWAALAAVVEIESAGRVFAAVNGRNEPVIRFEGHYFHRLLSGTKREQAIRAGLAARTRNGWRDVKNPRDQQARWDRLLNPARRIDDDAALSSCSWGVGQVMGSHWKHLGFKSVQDLVALARSGVEGQIELMAKFILKNGLADEMRRLDFAAFARGYNGPAFAKNKYDVKMAAAYRRYNGGSAPRPSSSTMLRLGSRGAGVRELQVLLVRAGANLKVDGDFGPATRDAVRAFQQSKRIAPDGVAGPQTMRELAAYRQNDTERPGAVGLLSDADVGKGVGVGVGGAAALETANQTVTDVLANFGHTLPASVASGLSVAAAGLAVAGIAYAGWSWWQKRRTVEGDERLEWA